MIHKRKDVCVRLAEKIRNQVRQRPLSAGLLARSMTSCRSGNNDKFFASWNLYAVLMACALGVPGGSFAGSG